MSNKEDVVNLHNDIINEYIPITPMKHVDLEKYVDRHSYFKAMVGDFGRISSVEPLGNNKYKIVNSDDESNPYYLQKLSGISYSSYLGCEERPQWFVLHQPDQMMAVIVVVEKKLNGKKHPYRFYNDAYRKIIRQANGKIKLIEKGGGHEIEIHNGLFSYRRTGLYRIARSWKTEIGYCLLNYIKDRWTWAFKDYTDVYHLNDSFFFVGSRGQMMQLALTMVDKRMDRICKHKIASPYFYPQMKNLSSGIIPDDIAEDAGVIDINVVDTVVPIVSQTDDGRLVFYKHNFDRYKSEVEKKLMIN